MGGKGYSSVLQTCDPHSYTDPDADGCGHSGSC